MTQTTYGAASLSILLGLTSSEQSSGSVFVSNLGVLGSFVMFFLHFRESYYGYYYYYYLPLLKQGTIRKAIVAGCAGYLAVSTYVAFYLCEAVQHFVIREISLVILPVVMLLTNVATEQAPKLLKVYSCYLVSLIALLLGLHRWILPTTWEFSALSSFVIYLLSIMLVEMWIRVMQQYWHLNRKTERISRKLSEEMKIKHIHQKLDAAGFSSDSASQCCVVAIARGYLRFTGLAHELSADAINGLTLQPIEVGLCHCGFRPSLKMLLEQPDNPGTDLTDGAYGATVVCDACGERCFVTKMCQGKFLVESGKFHHHCQECEVGFAKCLGSFEIQHCHACGHHHHRRQPCSPKVPL